MPVKVKARPGEAAPMLMKRFKKACDNERLKDQIKRAATYEKPSDMRRRKKNSQARPGLAAAGPRSTRGGRRSGRAPSSPRRRPGVGFHTSRRRAAHGRDGEDGGPVGR